MGASLRPQSHRLYALAALNRKCPTCRFVASPPETTELLESLTLLLSMTPFAQRELTGWGRYPRQRCRVARPEKRRELVAAASDTEVPNLIARGLGRSYGDAALNDASGVLLTEKLGRFLGFDAESATLHAEGGASLADIVNTFVPRGYFLPVTPGTRFVTIGGAIACDVHGKNHHRDGCFSEHLEEFELLLASSEVLICSRTQNPAAFWATIGGMGLTGVILSAKIRLMPIQTAFVRVSYARTKNLEETLAQLTRDAATRYPVAWLDCLATGSNLGRGVAMSGDLAGVDEVSGEPLLLESGRRRAVPLDFPDFALNPRSVKAFNALYYAAHSEVQRVVSFERFFWPLDSVGGWNRIYGARGFIQYQCVLPPQTAPQGLRQLLDTVAASGRAPFLAVLKLFGEANAAPLSFPFAGYCLALDLPAAPGIVEFAQELDAITLNHGGRVYLAKDATLTPQSLRRMYPRLPEFEAVKAQLDPNWRFQSSLSKRLGIGGAA
ncbi:MAG: decaprenylphospho-beta-D-ribofuranose 2-oxidase [Abditibacteriota bacterium]|nr:decaprenylphospho-beta-D-ribofuranose 2-oxidase [Abditibacteriota bacterium]